MKILGEWSGSFLCFPLDNQIIFIFLANVATFTVTAEEAVRGFISLFALYFFVRVSFYYASNVIQVLSSHVCYCSQTPWWKRSLLISFILPLFLWSQSSRANSLRNIKFFFFLHFSPVFITLSYILRYVSFFSLSQLSVFSSFLYLGSPILRFLHITNNSQSSVKFIALFIIRFSSI